MFKCRFVLAAALGLMIIAGCGKDEEKQTPEKPTVEAPPPEKPKGSPPLTAADAEDDATYGPLFPASDKVQGWIKTESVRSTPGGQIDEVLWDLAKVLRSYEPKTIVTATYKRYHDDATETVRAFVIKAPSPADAYGMLTVSCDGRDQVKIGDVYRVSDQTLYVVRGEHFAVFKASTTGTDRDHLIEGAEILAGNTVFNLAGRGGPGELVQILQSVDLPEAKVFFVRSLESLTGSVGSDVLDQIGLTEIDKMNRLLGLGGKTGLALAAYQVENWPRCNIIWLARYGSDQDALKVYQDYKSVLRQASPESGLHNDTMLKAPRGRYLLGCWSMEEESLNFLIPTIDNRLP